MQRRAQEVDPKFIASLREPGSSREATSAPQKVAGQDTPAVVGYRQGRHFHERPVNLSPWHVAEASEGVWQRSVHAHHRGAVFVSKIIHGCGVAEVVPLRLQKERKDALGLLADLVRAGCVERAYAWPRGRADPERPLPQPGREEGASPINPKSMVNIFSGRISVDAPTETLHHRF